MRSNFFPGIIKKIFASAIFILVIIEISIAQRILPVEQVTVNLKAVINVKHLNFDPNYLPPPAPPKAPNPPKPRLPKKATTDEELRKEIFPVTTITPMQQRNNVQGQESIFESPCVVEQGLDQLASTIPPDVAGAVGFDHIFLALNDRMRIAEKSGTVVLEQRQAQSGGFWTNLDTTGLFDPKIVYDPLNRRWIYVICADSRSATSSILIAVSQTHDPTGSWYQYLIDADADNNQWFDYPSIGFNKNWFVVTGNMFSNPGAGGASEARVFIFNLQQLYTGSALTFTVSNTSGYSTICPAITYDVFQNDLWCVTNDDQDDNDLRFFKISGSQASPSFTEESFISIGTAWGRGDIDIAPQSGTSTRINPGDDRVVSVVWRNNSLFVAQTIHMPDSQNPPDYCTIQFVICDPANATVQQANRFTASSTSMYAYPFLTVNSNGDIIISCSKFTTSTFPSACVLVRRGGTTTFTETTFEAGDDWYVNMDGQGRNRWGDYTTAMVDPSDDQSVWVASEYSLTRVGGNSRWSTRWAKICSNFCPSTVLVNTTQGPTMMRKYESGDVIYATSEIQAGAIIKLDAANRIVFSTNFRAVSGSKVRAFIEGCGGRQ